ncbi:MULTISPECIES: DUF551 domain-containing protein [Pseudomonas syringae group]|uniref:DUF551 domain-containing protein n=1 Tax=Pseudomonas syringae group TaxID=136849 RepID=UPI0005179607|nr:MULTISPECIES: DUF551 domain-containing protein [Pseudomonas syringae group]KGK96184.1 hypothetical protein NB04_06900 [Pseudomonas syringae pv. tomato]MBM1212902.1 DUF551 domain-containing protein [Pseudomonas syringae]MBM1218018.1 DUF551 domain-containing protein [Pseudomonas syringae]MBX6404112.1 DUF551 domain-containing protein [Pseudomonas syringae pv. tomato]MBX6412634.1 DUF551 domain-containing protein [Pseudomonas syringae pv. tomato]
MSEWIKCTDMLPELAPGDDECSSNVLVYEVDIGARMIQAFYSRDDELWYDEGGDQLDGEVTHWMPLPQPPTA